MTQTTGAEYWRPPAPGGAALPRTAGAAVQDSPVAFVALLAFVVLLLLAPQASVPELGRVRVALLIGALAVLSHCWTRLAAGRPLMRRTREMGLIVALLAWIIVTFPLSRWPEASTQVFLGEYLKTLGVFWLISNCITTLGRLRTVAWVLSLAAAPLAATGVWNFLSANLVRGRIAGYEAPLTADPNALAMVLNLILPFTAGLFLISRRPTVRVLLAGLIALNAGAIVVTFSRGGFLTLVTTFVLYLRTLQKRRNWRWAIAALVLPIAAIPLLPLGYVDRLGTINNIEADETGSAQERWELTRNGLRYAIGHPLFGAGLGMNVIADCERRGVPASSCGRMCADGPVPPCLAVHSVYLQFAMDLGWPGLGLFLLLLVSSVRSAARVRERSAAWPALQDLATLAEAIRFAIVGFAVAALFYPWAYFPYFYLIAGLAVAAVIVCETEVHRAAASAQAAC